jgi:hypothetical protein
MTTRTPPPGPDPSDHVWFDPPDDIAGDFGPTGTGPASGPASGPAGDVRTAAAPVPQALPGEQFAFGKPYTGKGGRALVTIGVVMALIAGLLFFWFSRSGGGGVALALDMSKGQSMAYSMSLSMNGTLSVEGQSEPVAANVDGHLGWKVVSVDADGTATVAMHLTKLSARAGSKTVKLKATTVTVKISHDGRLLSGTDLSVLGRSQSGLPGGSQFMPILPDHAVKPGDSWSEGYQQTSDLGYAPIDIQATGTLIKFETDDGHRVAVVQTTENIPVHMTVQMSEVAKAMNLPNVPPSAKVTYSGNVNVQSYAWLDTTTSRVLKSNSNAKFDLTMVFSGFGQGVPEGASVSFNGTLSMSLAASKPASAA